MKTTVEQLEQRLGKEQLATAKKFAGLNHTLNAFMKNTNALIKELEDARKEQKTVNKHVRDSMYQIILDNQGSQRVPKPSLFTKWFKRKK